MRQVFLQTFGAYLLNISLFYKDITSQPGWVYYQNMNGTVQVNRIENNNYEDIRGIELTLKEYGTLHYWHDKLYLSCSIVRIFWFIKSISRP